MASKSTRLDLWRKAISLFYQRQRPPFVGPFKATGYRGVGPAGIKVDAKLLDADGQEATPDLVSTNDVHWVALELTTDPHKHKGKTLANYSKLDGQYLTSHGLPHIAAGPIVMLVRHEPAADHVDDADFPLLILADTFSATNIDKLPDEDLATALAEFVGTPLDNAPELRFTLLPEQCGKPIEIRRGIAASIMAMFRGLGTPDATGITAAEIVAECLDDLVHAVSVESRQKLEEQVDGQVQILLDQFGMAKFMSRERRMYKANADQNINHPGTLQKLQRLVQAWVSDDHAQKTLEGIID